MSYPANSTAQIDLLNEFEADDTQFSSFLEALADESEDAWLCDVLVPDQAPAEGFQQDWNEEAPPTNNHVSSKLKLAVYSTPYMPDGLAAASGEGVRSSEHAPCSLVDLPTAQDAKNERFRAKNRRNQQAYRVRVKVWSLLAVTVTHLCSIQAQLLTILM